MDLLDPDVEVFKRDRLDAALEPESCSIIKVGQLDQKEEAGWLNDRLRVSN
jgi:hypothetical protein